MSSNDLNLDRILYQSQLRHKPVDGNYQDIETNFNALRAEVYASIASTASEVTSARDKLGSLTENIKVRRVHGYRVDGTGSYDVTNESGLVVRVASGSGIVNGIGVYHNTSATATITAPAAGNKRIDYVVLGTDNSRSILPGAATTGTAYPPSLVANQMPVAKWTVYDTTASPSITDMRQNIIDPFLDKEYTDAAYTFSGATATQYTLTDIRDNTYTIDLSYTGETVASMGVSVAGIRNTIAFTYSGETITNYTQNIS